MNPHDSDLPPPAPEAPVAGDDAPAPAAPKRRRAPRKPAAEASAPSGELADVVPAAPQAAGPVEAPTVGAEQAGAGSGEAGALAESGGSREAAEAGEAGEDGSDQPRGARRGRNRRRGKRSGEKRADGLPGEAEGASPADADAAAPRHLPQPQAVEVFAEVLSGAFDDEAVTAPAADASPLAALPGTAADVTEPIDTAPPSPAEPPKRVLAAEADAPKLHKVLAQAGAGSRRDLEQMIADGRVTVNGEPAHTGQRISFGDRIAVDGKPIRVRIAPPPARVLAYHKPAGEVVTHDDPQQRPTVFRRLPRLQQGKWQSVGRLDINTEGLLLFTNSGELANQLMHPRFGVEREYAVRSLGVLGNDAKARLLEGVEIDGQTCAFKSIEDGGGEGANHWYRCVITEGRNREVRKLFEAVGHAVSRLIRIRYGSVVLPRGLKRGVWVDLGDEDLRTLRRLAGAPPRVERDGPREAAREGERDDREGGRGRNRRGGRNKRRDGTPADVVAVAERPPRPDRLDRPDRPPRPERGPRAERPPRGETGERAERGEGGPIPNPLQQTFDKRAIQQERALRREIPEDGPIPNPLQQTYDKRALMRDRQPQRDIPEDGPIPNPLQQTYDKRFAQGTPFGGGLGGPGGGRGKGKGGGFGGKGGPKPGGGGRGKPAPKKAGGAPREPDPMQTSVGYIGGDAFLRKGGPGGRGGPRSGGRGPAGGGGGSGSGGRGRR